MAELRCYQCRSDGTCGLNHGPFHKWSKPSEDGWVVCENCNLESLGPVGTVCATPRNEGEQE